MFSGVTYLISRWTLTGIYLVWLSKISLNLYMVTIRGRLEMARMFPWCTAWRGKLGWKRMIRLEDGMRIRSYIRIGIMSRTSGATFSISNCRYLSGTQLNTGFQIQNTL